MFHRGFLILITQPAGATVHIDDVANGPVGTSPLSGTLEGEHQIFAAKPGFTRAEKRLVLPPHKVMVVMMMLSPTP